MRNKKPGARSMDFEISPDDRIGGSPKRRGRAPVPKSRKPQKPRKGERVEPGFFTALDAYDEPRRGRAPKQKKSRGGRTRRDRKPFSLWRLLGKLFYWVATLGVVAALAIGGIVYYYWMQMPAATTWKVPDRPANIRIVAADGQMMSNR